MLTVAGLTPSLDITYRVDSLVPGAIHRPIEVVRCAGGKALNLARAAANLGAEPAVVAVLGGPTGTGLADALTAAGIAVRVVATEAETRVCVSIAAEDAPGLTEIYAYADPVPEPVWQSFALAVRETMAGRPGWLAIPGGPSRGLAGEALASLAARAREDGRRVAIDTHGEALRSVLAARPDLVKVNRAEAAELLGCRPDDALPLMAARVRELAGGAVVVLTDGEHGCVGLDDAGCWRVGVPEGRRGRYPVGSGDAFLAGLLVGLDGLDGSDGTTAPGPVGSRLPEALRLATAAGAANALVPGPGRFTGDAARELAGLIEVADERVGG